MQSIGRKVNTADNRLHVANSIRKRGRKKDDDEEEKVLLLVSQTAILSALPRNRLASFALPGEGKQEAR
jgi:hypothetical protein